MAFTQELRSLKHVRIIVKHDPALDWDAMEDTDIWPTYQEDPIKNEGLLKFKEGEKPTIFICNFELSGKQKAAIKDATIGGHDEDKNPKITYGKWEYTLVSMVLKEIENPGIFKLKKDSRGNVDEFTMSQLEKYGIVGELFISYMTLTGTDQDLKANVKN